MNQYEVNNEKGRSMIEMLGVLAIVGVLSVAGIAGYSKAMAKYKANKLMDQVSTLAANIKTLFAATGSYNGLENNVRAFNLGLIPEEMTKNCTVANGQITSGTCVKNGMNGAVTIAPATNSVAGDSFSIKFEKLTKDACVAMMTADWGGAAGFRSIKANVGDPYTPATLASTGVYTAAKTACVADTDDGYEVTWVFY